jgi:hypothetical protein
MKWLMMVWMCVMSSVAPAQWKDPKWLAGAEGLGQSDGNIWSAAAYPASLTRRVGSSLGVYGEKRFLTDLLFFDLAYAGKLGELPFLVQAQREGNAFFSGNQVALGAAKSVHERWDIGIRLGYHATMARGYATTGSVAAGLGSLFKCNEQLTIGFQADGINHFFSPESSLGYRVRAGAGYRVSEIFTLTVEGLKEQSDPVAMMVAMHYRFLEQAWARMGYISKHNSFVCSMGFVYKGVETELSSTYHLSLGLSAGLSLMYRFNQDQ